MTDKQNGHTKPIASNDYVEYMAARKPRYSDGPAATIMGHMRKIPDQRALFAMTCIEKWGLVAAEIEGEDSAGRAKVRRMTPDEIVTHAVAVAQKAFTAFEREGWIIDIPSYPDLLDAVKDAENSND